MHGILMYFVETYRTLPIYREKMAQITPSLFSHVKELNASIKDATILSYGHKLGSCLEDPQLLSSSHQIEGAVALLKMAVDEQSFSPLSVKQVLQICAKWSFMGESKQDARDELVSLITIAGNRNQDIAVNIYFEKIREKLCIPPSGQTFSVVSENEEESPETASPMENPSVIVNEEPEEEMKVPLISKKRGRPSVKLRPIRNTASLSKGKVPGKKGHSVRVEVPILSQRPRKRTYSPNPIPSPTKERTSTEPVVYPTLPTLQDDISSCSSDDAGHPVVWKDKKLVAAQKFAELSEMLNEDLSE
jgi:hypothetical protein